MVKFLELPERPKSTAEKLMQGLNLGIMSIGDMIGSYEKKKSLDKIGSTLPEHQKKVWDSLGLDMQEKLAPGIFTSMQKRAGESEKIPMESARYLKEFHPALYDNPKAKQRISDLSRKYHDEGIGKTESFQKAIEEYRGKKSPSTPGGQGEQESGQPGFGMLPEGQDKESILQNLTKERSNIDPSTGRDISGNESILNLLSRPSTQKSQETLGALGLGQLGFAEDVASLSDPTQMALKIGQKMGVLPQGGGPAASELLREKLHKGKTPEERKILEATEAAGAFIPIEGAIFGLTKIGRQAGFFKNAERMAAKAGTSAEEAAQTILKQAQKEGIDLAKVAEGNKQEAGKLYNLSNRVSREVPETATELRMERAKPREKTFPKEERIKTRETQLKEFPKYEKEIAQDALERAERAEKRIPKTVKGMQSKQIRAHEAQKALPHAEEGYRKAIARVRALEDEAVKLKGLERERLNSLIEASKSELRDAEYALKQGIENLRGESYRVGLSDMREAAQKKLLQITDDIADGKPIELAKMDYNPEMIKEAKRISERKPIPAVKQDDFYQQVHKEYGDVYRKRLGEVDKELQSEAKSLASFQAKRNLLKEKDVLKKLIDQTEAERTIHRHKLSLRETAERKKAADRLAEFKKTEANPKVEKVAKEKIEEAIRNPTGKEAGEVAEKAGIKKEDLRTALDEIKKKTADIADKAKQNVPKAKIFREIDRFVKELKNKNWYGAFAKTPVGNQILITAAGILTEEILGKKIPYSSLATGLIPGSVGARVIRTGLLYLYREARNQFIKEGYKKAVFQENEEKVAKIRKKYPKLAREAAKDLAA